MIYNNMFENKYIDVSKLKRDKYGHLEIESINGRVLMERIKENEKIEAYEKIQEILKLNDVAGTEFIDKNNNENEVVIKVNEENLEVEKDLENKTSEDKTPENKDPNAKMEFPENTPYEDFLEKVNNEVMDILPMTAKHLFPELYMEGKPMPQQARDYLTRCNRGQEIFDQHTYYILYTYPWEDAPGNLANEYLNDKGNSKKKDNNKEDNNKL